jgi:hypothetical protein
VLKNALPKDELGFYLFSQGKKIKNAVSYLEKQLGIHIAASTNLTGATGDWTTIFGESKKFDSTPSTFVFVAAGIGGTFVEQFLNSVSSSRRKNFTTAKEC